MQSQTFRNLWALIEWIVAIGWAGAVIYAAIQAAKGNFTATLTSWTVWVLVLFILVSPYMLWHALRLPLVWLKVDDRRVTVTEVWLFRRRIRSFEQMGVGTPHLRERPDSDGGSIFSGLLPLPDGTEAEFSRHPNRHNTAAAVDRLRRALAERRL